MAQYNATFHTYPEDTIEMTGYSRPRGTWESNWLSMKIARGEITVFFPDLTAMSAFALQVQAAVDLAIRERANDDHEPPTPVERAVGSDA